MNEGKQAAGEALGQNPAVACAVFRTRNPEQLIQALTEALAGVGELISPEGPAKPSGQGEHPNAWLKHPNAAQFLEISPSALYRYACQLVA